MGEPSNEANPGEADLVAFAQRLRHQHVRGAVVDAVLRVVLALALPCLLTAWLLPASRLPIGVAVGGLAALLGGAAALRARRVADASLLRVADVDVGDDPRLLAELGDELATWLEARPQAAAPMRRWLAQDVRRRLPALPTTTVAAIGRRRLGGLAWIVPIVLLLLIAWFLANLLSPPWPGAVGGRQDHPAPGSGDGGGGADGRGGGAGRSDQQPASEKPPSEKPDRRDPPPPQANEAPTPKPEPPAPLLELPPQERFVVPEFLGDGPTRRARMHAAEVEEGAPAGAAAAQRAGEAPQAEVPPPLPEQFARAAEAAVASRHVPPAEQPMVRRFFDALQKAAK